MSVLASLCLRGPRTIFLRGPSTVMGQYGIIYLKRPPLTLCRPSSSSRSQLNMLSSIFPRHIIEHFVRHSEADPEQMGQLARMHEGVTVLFMDIVGE